MNANSEPECIRRFALGAQVVDIRPVPTLRNGQRPNVLRSELLMIGGVVISYHLPAFC